MRSDMSKLIVERPRVYRGHRSRKSPGFPRGRKCDSPFEALPRIEALGRGYRKKSFNENLRPLFRFLRSNVGRPWTAVYSELRKHLKLSSTIQKHVMDHVADYVLRNVTRDAQGILYNSSGGRGLRFHPGYPILYVCPSTGALRELSRNDRPQWHARRIDERTYVLRLAGVWFMVHLQLIPPHDAQHGLTDALSGLPIHGWSFQRAIQERPKVWHPSLYPASKRVLSKEERIHYLSTPGTSTPVEA
jgi:hypothetical protein